MDEQLKRKLEERRKALYIAVRNQRPDLYRKAVEVGHLALTNFGGTDENKRAAIVEAAVMSLVADAAEIAT
jgi:hypothetical protein